MRKIFSLTLTATAKDQTWPETNNRTKLWRSFVFRSVQTNMFVPLKKLFLWASCPRGVYYAKPYNTQGCNRESEEIKTFEGCRTAVENLLKDGVLGNSLNGGERFGSQLVDIVKASTATDVTSLFWFFEKSSPSQFLLLRLHNSVLTERKITKSFSTKLRLDVHILLLLRFVLELLKKNQICPRWVVYQNVWKMVDGVLLFQLVKVSRKIILSPLLFFLFFLRRLV